MFVKFRVYYSGPLQISRTYKKKLNLQSLYGMGDIHAGFMTGIRSCTGITKIKKKCGDFHPDYFQIPVMGTSPAWPNVSQTGPLKAYFPRELKKSILRAFPKGVKKGNRESGDIWGPDLPTGGYSRRPFYDSENAGGGTALFFAECEEGGRGWGDLFFNCLAVLFRNHQHMTRSFLEILKAA
jgi:hypothetical protein